MAPVLAQVSGQVPALVSCQLLELVGTALDPALGMVLALVGTAPVPESGRILALVLSQILASVASVPVETVLDLASGMVLALVRTGPATAWDLASAVLALVGMVPVPAVGMVLVPAVGMVPALPS